MSYDIISQKKNQTIDDQLHDPLIQSEFQSSSTSIEQSLQNFNYRLRDLDKLMEIVGTTKDNEKLRTQIRESMNNCMTVLNDCSKQIQRFAKIPTNNPKSTKLKNDKEQAFKSTLQELSVKFQKTSQRIKEKEQLFIDLAEKRDSNQNLHDNEAIQIQVQKTEQLKLIAETDNMEEVIKQRKKEINQIESIMQDVVKITQTINKEVQASEEKVRRIDYHMDNAEKNVQGAKEELHEAETYQKKSGKCLIYLIIGGIVLLGIILAIVFGTRR